MNLDDLPITWQGEVLAEHIDRNGHMNITWYTALFGMGTMQALSNVGWVFQRKTDASDNSERRGIFALEQHLRYLSEVLLGEKLTIHTRYLARSEKRIHFIHFLRIRGNDKLAATGEVVMAYMDLNIRRMTEFPESVKQEIDRLMSLHSELQWPAPVCGSMRA